MDEITRSKIKELMAEMQSCMNDLVTEIERVSSTGDVTDLMRIKEYQVNLQSRFSQLKNILWNEKLLS